MQPFSYHCADTVEKASQSLKEKGTELIGGGTCILDLMKLYVMQPEHLVGMRPMMRGDIEDKGSTLLISALASNSTVAHHPLVNQEFPVLAQAILSGASPQLRNMATVAGNIMQRTRCCYFRDTAMRCNKRDPGSGCDALDGYNRMHAVLGGSDHCIAVHPSDMCVALTMLDSVVHLQNGSRLREIAFPDFHTLPGNRPDVETVIEDGEVIIAVEIRKSPLARHSMYLKVRDRASFSFALSSAAAALSTKSGIIHEARLALGGVATKPWRATAAEKFLAGKSAGKDSFSRAAELVMQGAEPRQHNAFKVALAQRTIVRVYEELLAR